MSALSSELTTLMSAGRRHSTTDQPPSSERLRWSCSTSSSWDCRTRILSSGVKGEKHTRRVSCLLVTNSPVESTRVTSVTAACCFIKIRRHFLWFCVWTMIREISDSQLAVMLHWFTLKFTLCLGWPVVCFPGLRRWRWRRQFSQSVTSLMTRWRWGRGDRRCFWAAPAGQVRGGDIKKAYWGKLNLLFKL